MLGLRKRKKSVTNWQWDVAGKHPVARDFFALGQPSLMAEAFTEWIRRGAESLAFTSKELLVHSCSWRFWAKTPQAGVLACGVIRNSCDSVGRPFPLLVMGTGKLENWEDNWELLPFACEGSWRQMEQLASRKYKSFEVFQEDVGQLRPPQGRWHEMNLVKTALAENNESSANFDFHLGLLEQDQALFLPFQETGQYDFFTMIDNVHSLLKIKIRAPSNSIFMGGLIEHPGLVLLKRPLAGKDFERMWIPGTK
ncbi:MAG: type VI secretion system-associated protein TagF [Desulforhopalus sp.]|nr:type VI secretion system-associated protein TagF [Desulforhopalus sp.]